MGNNGGLPWTHGSMQNDTKRLHALANGKTIVMGERAYHDYKDVQKSFNTSSVIVLSRSTQKLSDAVVVDSIDKIVERSRAEDLWVVGGGQTFTQLLPYVKKMYLTEINADLPADAFFPKYSMSDWNVTKKSYSADEYNKYDYTFLDLVRK